MAGGSLPNLPVVLPDYAHLDGAFEVTVPFEEILDARDIDHVVDSRFVEVAIIAQVLYIAGPAVGNRQLILQLLTAQGQTGAQIAAPVVQTAGSLFSYTWTTAVTASQANNGFVIMPMVPLPLTGGAIVRIRESSGFDDGTFTGASVTLLRIPTGPPVLPDPFAVTPLVV